MRRFKTLPEWLVSVLVLGTVFSSLSVTVSEMALAEETRNPSPAESSVTQAPANQPAPEQPAKPKLKPPFFEEERSFDLGFPQTFVTDALFGRPDPCAGGGTGTDFNPAIRNPAARQRSFAIFEQLPR
jgi:hypothetical protein